MSLLLCASFFYFVLPSAKSSLLYQCPDFYRSFSSAKAGNEHNNDSETLSVPAHLMSNFQSYQFRMVFGNAPSCEMNYDVIRVNLTETDTIKITSTTESSSAIMDEDLSLSSNSFSDNTSLRYSEGFMYSTDNITALSNNTYLEMEEPLCDRKLSRGEVQFTPDGYFYYYGDYFHPKEYCIQTFNEEESWMVIRRCPVNCSNENTPCIPLCCHLHEYIDLSVPCCQSPSEAMPIFQPTIYSSINPRLFHEDPIQSVRVLWNGSNYISGQQLRPHYFKQKREECSDGLPPIYDFFNEKGFSSINTRFFVQSDGRLAYIGDNRNWGYMDSYCVAGIVNKDGVDGIEDMTTIVSYCHHEDERKNDTLYSIYVGVFSVSSIFLLLTVLVYVLLWDKQNIHGWTVMSFAISELFLFIFLTATYAMGLFSSGDETSKTAYCVGSAVLAHFFFLTTFTWLTIVNLDLYWTFKNFTPISERSKGKKRFCLYMLFAWGVPLAVVTTGIVLQQTYRSNESGVIVPNYGKRDCFISPHARGVYLYYIIGLLILVNFILISCTVITLYRFKKSARIASTSSSKTKERSFRLFVKLVVVMGVTWSLEFIMWLTDLKNAIWLSFLVDVFNILQAIATFIIFVCKRKILNQLEQKYPCLSVITKPMLKMLANRPGNVVNSSTESKRTRSTTMTSGASSRRRSQKASFGDSRL